jgi:chemotaxis protein methyltransferase WspC
MSRIERMLKDKIGLDASSIGSSLIQRTVRLRMKSLGVKSAEQYERLLARSQDEWDELVESVVVTETWFFRDREPFSVFVRLLFGEWLPTHPGNRVKVLSLPCSSGEEPYSLVMALLDSGVPPERFEVHALDISQRVLARARRGVYSRNSFRGKDIEFRERYFLATKEGFVLNAAIRNLVQFSQANLLSDEFPIGNGTCDFIFCRNLLIYFDRPTQQKALERIAQLLAPSGVLFVGPAEQPLVMEHGFVSANIPMAFACRKSSHAILGDDRSPLHRLSGATASLLSSIDRSGYAPKDVAVQQPAHHPIFGPLSSMPEPNGNGIATPPPSSTFHVPSLASVASPTPPESGQSVATRQPQTDHVDLDHARRLADAGRLTEAAAICETHLRQSRRSAQAYYLLGLIRDAAADASAVDCYRKALYLEPGHYESLLQMALLAEKNGDTARARTYKRRAERAKMKT